MVTLWRIQLFGGLTACRGEEHVSRFRTQKTGALLAYLALSHGRTVPREVLLDVLWPESEPQAARNSLSVALSSLRSQLEGASVSPGASPLGQVLIADLTSIRLSADAVETDVAMFDALVSRGDPESLAAALQLYGGELLPGFYEDWAVSERERLIVRADDARKRLARLESSAAVGVAPTREQPYVAAAPVIGSVPVALDRFFGRGEERAAIRARLAENPAALVTLTGPGGAGKTRLAIEAAADASEARSDGGAWFVPLADVATAGGLIEAVRNTLGLSREARTDPLDQLVEHLATRRTLLILDNMEHLLGRGPLDPDGAAACVRRLRQRLPMAAILITSRQALGLDGEEELPLEMLPVPAPSGLSPEELIRFPSVRLFTDRARHRRPDFHITARNADTVACLVARLEGIPLALELAAAWSGLLTPVQMLARLEERFAFLVARRANVTERQRTLYAAIDWGYELLTPEARHAFTALSVFRGDWTTEAAQSVLEGDGGPVAPGRTLECLTQLRAASFLRATDAENELRFQLLETLREFAQEQLPGGECALLERRHAEFYCLRAEQIYARRNGPAAAADIDGLEADLANLRVALERYSTQETGIRLAALLAHFWKLRGYYREGRDWLDRVLVAASQSPLPAVGDALRGAGVLAEDMGDYAAASGYYERGADFYRAQGELESVAHLTHNRGNVDYRQGHYAAAGRLYLEALAIYQQCESGWGIASSLGSLGNVAQAEGRIGEARGHQEESLRRSREIGDARMTAYTLHNLGNIALLEKDPVRARALFTESLEQKRSLGDRRGVASSLNALGFLALEEDQAARAAPLFEESLRVFLELGNRYFIVSSIEGMAWCAGVSEQPERAIRLWAATAAAREALGTPLVAEDRDTFDQQIAAARAALPAATFQRASAQGRGLTLEAAAELALSLPTL